MGHLNIKETKGTQEMIFSSELSPKWDLFDNNDYAYWKWQEHSYGSNIMTESRDEAKSRRIPLFYSPFSLFNSSRIPRIPLPSWWNGNSETLPAHFFNWFFKKSPKHFDMLNSSTCSRILRHRCLSTVPTSEKNYSQAVTQKYGQKLADYMQFDRNWKVTKG